MLDFNKNNNFNEKYLSFPILGISIIIFKLAMKLITVIFDLDE